MLRGVRVDDAREVVGPRVNRLAEGVVEGRVTGMPMFLGVAALSTVCTALPPARATVMLSEGAGLPVVRGSVSLDERCPVVADTGRANVRARCDVGDLPTAVVST
jgi:hypothetical protein